MHFWVMFLLYFLSAQPASIKYILLPHYLLPPLLLYAYIHSKSTQQTTSTLSPLPAYLPTLSRFLPARPVRPVRSPCNEGIDKRETRAPFSSTIERKLTSDCLPPNKTHPHPHPRRRHVKAKAKHKQSTLHYTHPPLAVVSAPSFLPSSNLNHAVSRERLIRDSHVPRPRPSSFFLRVAGRCLSIAMACRATSVERRRGGKFSTPLPLGVGVGVGMGV